MTIGKRFFVMVLSLVLCFGTAAFAAPMHQNVAPRLEITVDDAVKPMMAEGSIYIIDGRTYVPLKYFSQALNIDAGWHGARKVAYVGVTPEWDAVDKDPVAEADPLPIRFYYEGVKTEVPAGQAVFVENNNPYVPLRFVAEKMGCQVMWTAGKDKNHIQIKKQMPLD